MMAGEVSAPGWEAVTRRSASLAARVAARLIDLAAVVVVGVLGIVACVQPVSIALDDTKVSGPSIWIGPIMFLVGLAIVVHWWWSWAAREGRSPGRAAMGLELVGWDNQPIGYQAVALRAATRFLIEGLFPIIGTLVNLVVLMRGGQAASQTLHDKLVHARVVEFTPNPTPPAAMLGRGTRAAGPRLNTEAFYPSADGSTVDSEGEDLYSLPALPPAVGDESTVSSSEPVTGQMEPVAEQNAEVELEPSSDDDDDDIVEAEIVATDEQIAVPPVTPVGGGMEPLDNPREAFGLDEPQHHASAAEPERAPWDEQTPAPEAAPKEPAVEASADDETVTGHPILPSADTSAMPVNVARHAAADPEPEAEAMPWENGEAWNEDEDLDAAWEVAPESGVLTLGQLPPETSSPAVGATPVAERQGETDADRMAEVSAAQTIDEPEPEPATQPDVWFPEVVDEDGDTDSHEVIAEAAPAAEEPAGEAVDAHWDDKEVTSNDGAGLEQTGPVAATSAHENPFDTPLDSDGGDDAEMPAFTSGVSARGGNPFDDEPESQSAVDEAASASPFPYSPAISPSTQAFVGPFGVAATSLAWTLIGVDTEQSIPVERKVMLGRKPSLENTNVDDADTVAIFDETLSVSKSHCLVGVDEEGLWIVDWGSRNGTFVAPGGADWEQLQAHQPYRLLEGDLLRLGNVDFDIQKPQ